MTDSRSTPDPIVSAAAAATRHFAAEPLERRTLLSVDVSLSGDAGRDTFYVTEQAGAIQFYRNATPQTGSPVETVPAASLGSVFVYGNGGPDTLTIDYADGDRNLFPGGINFFADPAADDAEVTVLNRPTFQAVFVGAGSNQLLLHDNRDPIDDTLTYAGVASFGIASDDPRNSGTVTVGTGSVTFDADLGANAAAVGLHVYAGASATFRTTQHLNNLTVDGTAAMSAGGGHVLVANTLSVAGTLDLADNDLIVDSPSVAALTTLQEAVGAGYRTTPAPAGSIYSSAAAAAGYALGVAPVADLPDAPTAVDGQPLPRAGLLVRYTRPGDVNLDGFVRSDDFTILASHYNTSPGTSPPAWYLGDLNYDGTINSGDFTYLAGYYNQVAVAPPTAVVVGRPFTLTTNFLTGVAHLDVDWGDGGLVSYPPNTAPTYAYAGPGYDLVQATATLTDGSTVRLPPKLFVVSPATAGTAEHLDLPTAGTYTLASDGQGDTILTGPDGGQLLNVPTDTLLSLAVTGNVANELVLDLSDGDPVPASGLFYQGRTLTFAGTSATDTLVTTETAAFADGALVYHPPVTALRFADAGPGDVLLAVAGSTSVAGDSASGTDGGPAVVVGPGAVVTFTRSTTVSALDVAAGGTARMVADGTNVLDVADLTLEQGTATQAGGVLDLADNDLIVRADPTGTADVLGSVTALLANRSDAGAWDGLGAGPAPAILSTTAAATAGLDLFAAAPAVGRVGGVDGPPAGLFDGRTVGAGDVVARYGYNDGTGPGTPDAFTAPPIAEGQSTYALSFPTAVLTDPLGFTPLLSWTVHWGDGTSDTTLVTDPSLNTLTANHGYPSAYASAAVAGLISVSGTGILPDGSTATYSPPHTALLVAPRPPTDVIATELQSGEVNLTWDEPSALADAYTVVATPDGGGQPITVTVSDGVNGAAVTELLPGETYTFTVAAVVTNGGVMTASLHPTAVRTTVPDVSLTANAPAVIDEGAAAAIAVVAPAAASSIIPEIVAWQARWSDGATAYLSEYGAGTTTSFPGHVFPSGTTSEIATVTATDAAGRTFTLPPVTVGIRFAAPTDVTVADVTADSVTLAWQVNSAAANAYDVFRADGGDPTAPFEQVDQIDAPGTRAGTVTYVDTTVTADQTYQYEVRAAAGTDSVATQSGFVPAVAPAAVPPETLHLTAHVDPTHKNAVNLTWSYAAKNDAGYELEMKDDSTGENFHTIATPGPALGNGLSFFTKYDLTWGDTYEFRVRADRTDQTVTNYVTSGPLLVPILDAPNLHARVIDQGTGFTAIHDLQLWWDGLPDDGISVAIQVSNSDAYAEPALWRDVLNGSDYAWPSDTPPLDSDPTVNVRFRAPSGAQGIALNPGVIAQSGHYQYRIRCNGPDGEPTKWSMPQGASLVDRAATQPTVVSKTDTTIALTWTDTAPAGYEEFSGLLMRQDGGSADSIEGYGAAEASNEDPATGSPVSVVQTRTITGLVPGTKYFFAFDSEVYGPFYPGQDGEGEWAFRTFDVTTTGPAPAGPMPAAPGRVLAPVTYADSPTPVSGNVVHLSWLNAPNNEDGFEVWRSLNPSTSNSVNVIPPQLTSQFQPKLVATLSPDVTNYDDPGVRPGSYNYLIRSGRNGVKSAFSSISVDVWPPGYLVAYDGTWDGTPPDGNRTTIIKQFSDVYHPTIQPGLEGRDYQSGVGSPGSGDGLLMHLLDGGFAFRAGSFIDSALQNLGKFYRSRWNREHVPVDVIGYSRGAFMATLLANIISSGGVPDLSDEKTIQVGQGSQASTYHEYPSTGRLPGVLLRFVGLVSPVAETGIDPLVSLLLPGSPQLLLGWPTTLPAGIPSVGQILDGHPNAWPFVQTTVQPGPYGDNSSYTTTDTHPDIGTDHLAFGWLLDRGNAANAPVPSSAAMLINAYQSINH